MSTKKRFLAQNGLDANSLTITNIADPVNAQDAVTKNYGTNASNLASGTLAAARLPAFIGDATSTAGTSALTLANTAVTAGSYGSATSVATFTVDAKGRLTAASSVAIAPAWSSITGTPTTLSGYGITDGYSSSGGTISGNVVISGNLTINGTTTTVNSTVISVTDPIFSLGGTPVSNDSKDRGIQFNYFTTAAKSGFFGYDNSTGRFTFVPDATITGEVVSGTVGTIEANLLGNVTGNADTATKLATSRTISLTGDVTGSISFDGSANVSISTTIGADSVALGTDTTGNYIATLSAGTPGAQSGTSGLTISATAGENVAATIALSTTGVTAGTYGSGSQIPVITVDAQGRISSVTTASQSGSISLNDGIISSANLTTSTTTANQVVDSNSITNYRSVLYTVQVTSGASYHVTNIQVFHDGTTAYIDEFGTMFSGVSLATFDSDISAGNLRLLVSPTNAATTIRVIKKLINI